MERENRVFCKTAPVKSKATHGRKLESEVRARVERGGLECNAARKAKRSRNAGA